MARIAALCVYPVKSCAGIAVPAATIGLRGLEAQGVCDREWMVVDAGSGGFITQRELPRMALIAPAVEAGSLVLRAPGAAAPLAIPLAAGAGRTPTRRVQIWRHQCMAFDEGDAAAAWLEAVLGRALRLVRYDPADRRLANPEWVRGMEALNGFSDGYPILLISSASLTHLNDRLAEAGRDALPMNRFRPNIVIDGVEAHDEDRFTRLTADGIELRPVKPCPRCPIPSVDQATGVFGPDPLDILARYRDDPKLGVVFGQNVVAAAGIGRTVIVGQALDTEWNF